MSDNLIFIGNIKGEKGDTGTGLTVKDFYGTVDELNASVPNPSVGDAYGIGEEAPYDIYIYSETNGWVNSGAFQPDINEQAPTYAEATTLETLTSGEKVSIALGKIKKAISDFITHKADTTNHITSDERTAWNNKAPGGHGLGDIAFGTYNDTFNNTFQKGCGFYQLKSMDESPNNSNYWFPLMQISRTKEQGNEVGAQMAFLDGFDYEKDIPKVWFRTAALGVFSKWFEMLHTGNIDKFSKIIHGSYEGTGTHGDSNWGEGCNQLSLPSRPLVMMIRRHSEHFTSVITFTDEGTYWGEVYAGTEFSGGCVAMKYDNDTSILKWHGDPYKWKYVADLTTGDVTMKTTECEASDDILAKHQLNMLDETYYYTVICI